MLVEVARILREAVRLSDVVARWGGEEFVVLFANADLKEAVTISEDIRIKIETSPLLQKYTKKMVTASIGVVACDLNLDFDTNLNMADSYMYLSKERGRNKVTYTE